MEGLAPRRHQQRGDSIAQAFVVLSTPCCCWRGQRPKAHLKMLFASAGLILSPVTCTSPCCLGLPAQSGGLSLPSSLMLLCRSALCRQCGRLRDQSKDEPWQLPALPCDSPARGDGAEVEVIQVLGPCSITVSS